MKKILAMMLTAAMMLSMSAAVMAAEGETTETFTDMSTITFTKNYKVEGTTAVSPAETFEFENIKFESATETGVGYTEAWAKDNLPTINTVSYEKGDAGKEGEMTATFTITLPTNYPSVGIYVYSFNEVDKNTEGVTYNPTKMYLKVTVIEDGGVKRIAAVHCEGALAESGKVGAFDNTYKAGTLSVTKNVEGNMGDKTKEFEITVTFKASEGDTVMSDITYTDPDNTAATTIEAGNGWTEKTVTITLNDEETITFNNIPEGVTYTVVETDLANKAMANATDTYEATYTGETGTITAATASAAVVTNTKGTDVDTGISVDSIPYIAMLGVVAIGGTGIIVSKKRRSED